MKPNEPQKGVDKMSNGILKRCTAGVLSAAVIASIGFTALPATASTAGVDAMHVSATVESKALNPQLVAQKENILAFDKLINDERAKRGLPRLKFNATIAAESIHWSGQMQHGGHHRNAAQKAQEAFHDSGTLRGENVVGYGVNNTADAFALWTTSPGHMAEMMSPVYDVYGYGSSENNSTTVFRTDPFLGNLPNTYNSAADYFAGKPDLPTADELQVKSVPPTFDTKNHTYTIPNVSGAYYVKDSETIAPGTYTAGSEEIVFIRMFPTVQGYHIDGTSVWQQVFPVKSTTTTVTAPAPTFNVANRSFNIPSQAGVTYSMNGSDLPAGNRSVSNAQQTIKIDARANAGYKLSGTSTWSQAYPDATPLREVTAKAPSFNNETFTYTIPANPSPGYTYKVNGKTTNSGTYKSSPESKVTVTAVADAKYVMKGTSSWTHTFGKAPNDCQPFTDVKSGGSFYEPINWLSCNGITHGYVDGSYGVNRKITRAEAASFLYRIAGDGYISTSGRTFKDVKPNSAHYHAIAWMADKGYSVGYVDGSYGVNRDITRGELSSFAYRLAGEPGTKANKSSFPDVKWGGSHSEAITWLSEQNAISGYTDGSFRPSRTVTRGETAKILYVLKDA